MTGLPLSRRIISSSPRTALIGVRMSWLITDRKSDFARLAAFSASAVRESCRLNIISMIRLNTIISTRPQVMMMRSGMSVELSLSSLRGRLDMIIQSLAELTTAWAMIHSSPREFRMAVVPFPPVTLS